MTLTDFLLARIAEDEEMWTMARDGGMVIAVNGQSAIPPQSWVEGRVAECEAKRRIVAYAGAIAEDPTLPSTHLAQHVLADLALPYADHPDYREEWKP